MFGLKRSLRCLVSKIGTTQLTNISHVVGPAHPSYNDMVRAVAVYIRPCAFVCWPGSAIDFGTPVLRTKDIFRWASNTVHSSGMLYTRTGLEKHKF